MLGVNLYYIGDELFIEIADNGIGREKSGTQVKMSTGRGLEIMNELYQIYNRYYNERVTSEIIDIFDSSGKAAGTKVLISITRKNEKSRD